MDDSDNIEVFRYDMCDGRTNVVNDGCNSMMEVSVLIVLQRVQSILRLTISACVIRTI